MSALALRRWPERIRPTVRRFFGRDPQDYLLILEKEAALNPPGLIYYERLAYAAKAAGDAPLSSYGPNLSLALEVLKHGDQQSGQVVIQFLDEIKVFWNIDPTHYDEWKPQISAGEIPNFMAAGSNLYY